MDTNNLEIRVSPETIRTTKDEILNISSQLKGNLEKYLNVILDTKAIYNTEAADIYRRIVEIYIKYQLKKIGEDFDAFVSNLDEVANTDDDTINYISRKVNVGDEL